MKTKEYAILFFLTAFLAFAPSCRKSANNSVSNLKVATVDVTHYGGTQHYRFVYNVLNGVDTIASIGGGVDTGSNGFKAFTYYTNSYTITDENGNSVSIIATSGVIQEVKTSDTMLMTYYNNLLGRLTVKVPSSVYPYFITSISSYSWTNGDLNTITESSNIVETYSYNTSKSGQAGDAARIDNLLSYGKPLIKTNHLPTQISVNGTWTEEYFYQFDNGGRIAQMIKVRNSSGTAVDDSTTYSYTYY